jgi:Tfp pilus assembly protein PilF
VLIEAERPSEAQALFRTALALDPDYACAYRELRYVLSNRGPNPESESHLRKAIQLEHGDAWARIYRGTYLWESEEVDAAVSEFRIAGLSLSRRYNRDPACLTPAEEEVAGGRAA